MLFTAKPTCKGATCINKVNSCLHPTLPLEKKKSELGNLIGYVTNR